MSQINISLKVLIIRYLSMSGISKSFMAKIQYLIIISIVYSLESNLSIMSITLIRQNVKLWRLIEFVLFTNQQKVWISISLLISNSLSSFGIFPFEIVSFSKSLILVMLPLSFKPIIAFTKVNFLVKNCIFLV